MSILRRTHIGVVAFLLAGATGSAGLAQTGNGSAPQTLPGLDNFSLPSSRSTISPSPTPAPTPTPTPTPTATPTPAPVVAAPAVRANPAPVERDRTRPVPAPSATPSPRASATPVTPPAPLPERLPSAAETPAPAASPSPSSSPTASAAIPSSAAATGTAAAADGADGRWWPWLLGAVVIAAGAGWSLRQHRQTMAGGIQPATGMADASASTVAPPHPEPAPLAESSPPPAPVTTDASVRTPTIARPAPAMLEPLPVAARRAHLTLVLQPRRAGLNLLSATVEAELLVRNDGDLPASAVRIGAALVGATPGQGAEVATLFAQPVGRPVTPPFALSPGEERRIRTVVALARTELVPLQAGGRPLFVPVVTVNALYDAGSGEGQAARAFAVGIERVDSAKLAPLWLDQPPRMFEALGVRPYGTAIDR